MSDLRSRLRALGLLTTAATLDDFVALATKKRWGLTEALEHIVELEERDRARRGLERRMSRSRLETLQAHEPTSTGTGLPRSTGHSSSPPLVLDFVGAARNVVLVAPQGLGKTMIAQNIAHQAILAGPLGPLRHRRAAAARPRPLRSQRAPSSDAFATTRRSPARLDEVGFLAFDNRNADLLFQVVSRRYEKKSLVLTTNLAFRDWHTIFPNATCATALIDRVVHHADVISIEGESYRLREAERNASERRASRRTGKNAPPPCAADPRAPR